MKIVVANAFYHLLAFLLIQLAVPSPSISFYPEELIFDVRDYGAKGDNKTDDTVAFVEALKALISSQPVDFHRSTDKRPVLLVPAEGTYSISPINLTSNMILAIEDGATIAGIMDVGKYPLIPYLPSYGQGEDHPGPRYQSLIHGENVTNVAILGWGEGSVIDGQGAFWWDLNAQGLENYTRPPLLEFMYSSDLEVSNIAMKDSPFWTNHIYDSDRIHFHHMWVSAPNDIWGSDGWDPDSSRDVVIESSIYDGGDDCVAIKSGWDCFGVEFNKPSKNILVSNLTCRGPLASVAMGSEVSGGIENVRIENVVYDNVDSVAHIKWGPTRGGYVRNITFQDLTVVGQLAYGVHIDGTYGKGNDACDSSWTPPNLTDVSSISFINIDGTDAIIGNDDGDANAFHLVGIEGGPVTGIFISETQFTMSVDQGSPWLCSDVLGDAESGTVLPWPPCDEIQQVSSLDGYILKDFTSGGSTNRDSNNALSEGISCDSFGTSGEVPCVVVSSCDDLNSPIATLKNWTLVGPINGLSPLQNTEATICWDEHALIIESIIFDKNICSPYTSCGEKTYDDADVLEVFVAPVLEISDAPEFYYELDAAPSGALWAAAIDDSLGTSQYCSLLHEHCIAPGPLKACTGSATYAHGLNVETSKFYDSDAGQGWKARFTVPFDIFSLPFQPKLRPVDHIQPWKTWRLNMYRTDTSKNESSCGEAVEQSSWAHVDEHFHDPPKFGVLVLR